MATMNVVMVNSGDKNPAPHVYGFIKVLVTSPSGEPSTYILFEKARNQAVVVQESAAIPLRITHVPAQLGSGFEVQADLSDANAIGELDDHKIVNGSVSFIPSIPDSKNIIASDGSDGNVRVDVAWDPKQE